MVNVVGELPESHGGDSPLRTDLDAVAAAVVDVVIRVTDPVVDAERAVDEADRGAVVALIAPQDLMRRPVTEPSAPVTLKAELATDSPDPADLDMAIDLLAGGGLLLLGGTALRRPALVTAGRIAARLGCETAVELAPARWDRGRGVPAMAQLPYFAAAARAHLDGRAAVLVGAPWPVSWFGEDDGVWDLVDPTRPTVDWSDGRRAGAVLAALGARAGIPPGAPEGPDEPGVSDRPVAAVDDGPITSAQLAAAVMASLRPGDVVVDEAVTSGVDYRVLADAAPPHTMIGNTGGAIGFGPGAALGAGHAVAPGSRVVAIQADGSAAYTEMALWSMAATGVPVTVVIAANRRYAILDVELARAGFAPGETVARSMVELDRPPLDWCAIAVGHGLAARRAASGRELAAALAEVTASGGPGLVEAVMG